MRLITTLLLLIALAVAPRAAAGAVEDAIAAFDSTPSAANANNFFNRLAEEDFLDENTHFSTSTPTDSLNRTVINEVYYNLSNTYNAEEECLTLDVTSSTSVDDIIGKNINDEMVAAQYNGMILQVGGSVKIYGMSIQPEKVITGVEDISITPADAPTEHIIFNINGVRCSEPLAPGFYIIDGRKVIIR